MLLTSRATWKTKIKFKVFLIIITSSSFKWFDISQWTFIHTWWPYSISSFLGINKTVELIFWSCWWSQVCEGVCWIIWCLCMSKKSLHQFASKFALCFIRFSIELNKFTMMKMVNPQVNKDQLSWINEFSHSLS